MKKPPFNDLQGARSGQLRGRPRSAGTDLHRPDHRHAADPAAGDARLQEVRPLPARHGKGEGADQEANPSDRNITVWTDSEPENGEATYYQSVLTKLGFNAKLKEINADNYSTIIGNENTPNLDTGWSDWFEDYPHPNDFFQPLLAGESILPTNNTNFSQTDIPKLNARLAKLGEETLGPKQEGEYAEVDKEFMEEAPWVPYGTRTESTFVSSAIDLDKVIWNPTFEDDLTSFQFK